MTSSLHPSLESENHEDLISSSSPAASLFMFTIWDGFGSGVAVGTEVWGAPLVWDCNLIFRHTDFIKGVIRLVMFIWTANRLFHCLRTWKLVSKEQHKAANFPGLFAVCFWKRIKPGLPGSLWEWEFSLKQVGAIILGDFPKGLSPTMTWLGKYSLENMDLSYIGFRVNIQVGLTDSGCIHLKHLVLRFSMYAHLIIQNQGQGWLLIPLCSLVLFLCQPLKLAFPNSTENILKCHYLSGKTPVTHVW